MGVVKGGFLRVLQTILYFLAFCCAAIVLGIYSYFLAVQADRHQNIATYQKAVEGLSGAAVLYTIFAVILTCCLAGISVFSILGLLLDLAFVGCFIAIAVLTRNGANSCSGFVNTPLGSGNVNDPATGYGSNGFGEGNGGQGNLTYAVSNGTACKLNTAAFAVSIVAIVLFLITALMQLAIMRSHQKDKRFGPSPDNGYTSGPAKKRNFWTRKNKGDNFEKDAELGATGTAVGAGAGGLAAHHNHNTRPSHDTASTAVGTGAVNDKYDTNGTHGNYYNQPTGTGANPYGYENNNTATANTRGNTYNNSVLPNAYTSAAPEAYTAAPGTATNY